MHINKYLSILEEKGRKGKHMEDYIEKVLERGLGNIIDKNMDELVQTDEIYLQDSRDEDELEKRYLALNIGKQERLVIDDFIECMRTANARCVELAFIAGIRDTIKFLHGIDLLKDIKE